MLYLRTKNTAFVTLFLITVLHNYYILVYQRYTRISWIILYLRNEIQDMHTLDFPGLFTFACSASGIQKV